MPTSLELGNKPGWKSWELSGDKLREANLQIRSELRRSLVELGKKASPLANRTRG